MQLTKNFRLSEFTRSATASANGIDNTPSEQHVENLRQLCENVLQPVRDAWGAPLLISSGYRSPALNAILVRTNGASKTSQHMQGEAADLPCQDLAEAIRLAACILDHAVSFDQLIIEQSSKSVWLHVSFAEGRNRKSVFFQTN